MITQTLAILLDAYRELQSKKMFWIVMILNVLVVLLFGLLGVKDNTFTVLWYATPRVSHAMTFYKNIFSAGIVGFWFTWVAVILAMNMVPGTGAFGRIVNSAQNFQRYYHDLEQGQNSLNPIEHIVFSLVLSTSKSPEKTADSELTAGRT